MVVHACDPSTWEAEAPPPTPKSSQRKQGNALFTKCVEEKRIEISGKLRI